MINRVHFLYDEKQTSERARVIADIIKLLWVDVRFADDVRYKSVNMLH